MDGGNRLPSGATSARLHPNSLNKTKETNSAREQHCKDKKTRNKLYAYPYGLRGIEGQNLLSKESGPLFTKEVGLM